MDLSDPYHPWLTSKVDHHERRPVSEKGEAVSTHACMVRPTNAKVVKIVKASIIPYEGKQVNI